VLTFVGVSGGALAHRFEPLRPYLLVATYGFLAGAFFWSYRPRAAACAPGKTCVMPGTNAVGRLLLWASAAVVVLVTAFPWYSEYLF
jgi:hypothetical protein